MAQIPYVDIDDCRACGTCEAICPEVFKVNEELGYAEVINPTGGSEDAIQEAIDTYPTGCIHWTEE